MLAATLLATALAAPVLLPPEARADLARSLAAAAAFVSNLHFWKTSGYFDVAAQTRPLLHTWSLSLEEQFYLVVPLLLPGLLRRFPGRAVLLLLVAALASFGLSLWLTARAPTTSFYLLPTRAWELLLGSLLAFARPGAIPGRALREALAAAGLALILVPVAALRRGHPLPRPRRRAALPRGGADPPRGRVRPEPGRDAPVRSALRGVGLVLLPLYMVHWPLIVLTRYALLRDPDGPETVALLAVCGVLATAGWRWLETPFRRPAHPLPRAVLFPPDGGGSRRMPRLQSRRRVRGGPRRPAGTPLAGLEREGWRGGRCFLEDQDPAAWAGRPAGSPPAPGARPCSGAIPSPPTTYRGSPATPGP